MVADTCKLQCEVAPLSQALWDRGFYRSQSSEVLAFAVVVRQWALASSVTYVYAYRQDSCAAKSLMKPISLTGHLIEKMIVYFFENTTLRSAIKDQC